MNRGESANHHFGLVICALACVGACNGSGNSINSQSLEAII